jgi:hypothetical protein
MRGEIDPQMGLLTLTTPEKGDVLCNDVATGLPHREVVWSWSLFHRIDWHDLTVISFVGGVSFIAWTCSSHDRDGAVGRNLDIRAWMWKRKR